MKIQEQIKNNELLLCVRETAINTKIGEKLADGNSEEIRTINQWKAESRIMHEWLDNLSEKDLKCTD